MLHGVCVLVVALGDGRDRADLPPLVAWLGVTFEDEALQTRVCEASMKQAPEPTSDAGHSLRSLQRLDTPSRGSPGTRDNFRPGAKIQA